MTRIGLTLVLALVSTQFTGGPPESTADVAERPALVRAIGADHDERVRLDDALELFRRNELSLPSLDVHFFDDKSSCHGHYGLFEPSFDRWRIRICSDLPFVIPHELAHAWTAANLSEAKRSEYVNWRGLTTWNDKNVPWKERGTEDAAFVMQQVLMAQPELMNSPRWQDRLAAFERLTQSVSPRAGQPQRKRNT